MLSCEKLFSVFYRVSTLLSTEIPWYVIFYLLTVYLDLCVL